MTRVVPEGWEDRTKHSDAPWCGYCHGWGTEDHMTSDDYRHPPDRREQWYSVSDCYYCRGTGREDRMLVREVLKWDGWDPPWTPPNFPIEIYRAQRAAYQEWVDSFRRRKEPTKDQERGEQ